MCPWKSFDYDGNNYPGNMDYLVITAIGRPNVGKLIFMRTIKIDVGTLMVPAHATSFED